MRSNDLTPCGGDVPKGREGVQRGLKLRKAGLRNLLSPVIDHHMSNGGIVFDCVDRHILAVA